MAQNWGCCGIGQQLQLQFDLPWELPYAIGVATKKKIIINDQEPKDFNFSKSQGWWFVRLQGEGVLPGVATRGQALPTLKSGSYGLRNR